MKSGGRIASAFRFIDVIAQTDTLMAGTKRMTRGGAALGEFSDSGDDVVDAGSGEHEFSW